MKFFFSGKENKIIDYMTQQYKLFPHIGTVFALHFGADWLWTVYNNVTSEMEGGDLERLPEVSYNTVSLIADVITVIQAYGEVCIMVGGSCKISFSLPIAF